MNKILNDIEERQDLIIDYLTRNGCAEGKALTEIISFIKMHSSNLDATIPEDDFTAQVENDLKYLCDDKRVKKVSPNFNNFKLSLPYITLQYEDFDQVIHKAVSLEQDTYKNLSEDSILKKVRTLIDKKKFCIYPSFKMIDDSKYFCLEIVNSILNALLENKCINIQYREADKNINSYLLHPRGIIYQNNCMVLNAYMDGIPKIEKFQLHRIQFVEISLQKMNKKAMNKLSQISINKTSPFGNSSNFTLKALLNNDALDALYDEKIASNQIICFEPNTSEFKALLTVQLPNSAYYFNWILLQGSNIKILEPIHLKNKIANSAHILSLKYKKKHSVIENDPIAEKYLTEWELALRIDSYYNQLKECLDKLKTFENFPELETELIECYSKGHSYEEISHELLRLSLSTHYSNPKKNRDYIILFAILECFQAQLALTDCDLDLLDKFTSKIYGNLEELASLENTEIDPKKQIAKMGNSARLEKYDEAVAEVIRLLEVKKPPNGWKNKSVAINGIKDDLEQFINSHSIPLKGGGSLVTRLKDWSRNIPELKHKFEETMANKDINQPSTDRDK